jgi:hypothetical protein
LTSAAPAVTVESVTRLELFGFLRRYKLAVVATVGAPGGPGSVSSPASATGAPQAAVVGFAVSDELEIVFDARLSDFTREQPSITELHGDPFI